MKKPGRTAGGFISNDDVDGVVGCIEEVEEILGPLNHYLKTGLNAIIRQHYHLTAQKQGQPLKPTRASLQGIVQQCSDLSSAISKAKKEPSVYEALNLAEVEDFLPNQGRLSIDEVLNGLDERLRQFQLYAERAIGNLPGEESRRWPKELRPARELIKSLSSFYEEATGKPAKNGISQDRTQVDDKKYSGQFFELIDAVFIFLSIRDLSNPALGKLIYEALSE